MAELSALKGSCGRVIDDHPITQHHIKSDRITSASNFRIIYLKDTKRLRPPTLKYPPVTPLLNRPLETMYRRDYFASPEQGLCPWESVLTPDLQRQDFLGSDQHHGSSMIHPYIFQKQAAPGAPPKELRQWQISTCPFLYYLAPHRMTSPPCHHFTKVHSGSVRDYLARLTARLTQN